MKKKKSDPLERRLFSSRIIESACDFISSLKSSFYADENWTVNTDQYAMEMY